MLLDVALRLFVLVFLATSHYFIFVVNGSQEMKEEQSLFRELSIIDDKSEYVDPLDMGAYDPISKTMEKQAKNVESQGKPVEVENKPDYTKICADLETNCGAKLRQCQKEKKNCYLTLDKALSKSAEEQDSPFIKHFIRGLYDSLRLDDVTLQADEKLFIVMTAGITAQRKQVLETYLSTEKPSAEMLTNVEQVVAGLWEARQESFNENWKTYYVEALTELVYLFNATFGLEFWVLVVCVMPIPLSFWLMQKNHSVVKIAFLYIIFLFSVSWYWHWQHMYRDAMAKRQANLLQLQDLPEECTARPKGIAVAWTFVRNSFMGDPCHMYQLTQMVPTILEVSPTLALSETISRFVLHPLGFLGKQVSAFFGSILTNLSFYHGFIVLSVVTVLIVILLLVCFGYRLDFPFWLGGIGPGSRPETTGQLAVDRILQQSATILERTSELIQIQQRENLVVFSSVLHGPRVQEVHEFQQMTTTTTVERLPPRHEEPPQSTTASSTSTPPNSLRSSSAASLRDKDSETEETQSKKEGKEEEALEVRQPAAAREEDDAQLDAGAVESAQIPATAGIQEL